MASSGELLLSAPSRAIGARLMRKLYLPTALIADELPAGSLEAATCVPRFSTDEERLEAERLEEYVRAVYMCVYVHLCAYMYTCICMYIINSNSERREERSSEESSGEV